MKQAMKCRWACRQSKRLQLSLAFTFYVRVCSSREARTPSYRNPS